MKQAQYRIAVETRYNGDVWYIPQVRFVTEFLFGIKFSSKWKNIYKCPHGGYDFDDTYQESHLIEANACLSITGFIDYRNQILGKHVKTREYKYLKGL